MLQLTVDVRPRCFSGWRLGILALAAAGAFASAHGQDTAEPISEIITSFHEYWQESARDQSRPIRMEVTVSYFDPTWGNFWGEANGEVGFMKSTVGATVPPIRSRDRVLIEGTVIPERGLSTETATFRVLERDVQIVPLDATGRLGDYERYNSRLISINAIVDQQKVVELNHVEVRLIAEGYVLHVLHWSDPVEMFDAAPGSLVRLEGVYSPKLDPRTGTQEIDLWVAQKSDVRAIGNLANDPRFELPRVPTVASPRSILSAKTPRASPVSCAPTPRAVRSR